MLTPRFPKGGAIPKYGNRITVTVRSTEELGREVLKSDTAGLAIPEIELELDEGGLDGVYTTIEGLLDKLRDRLTKANPFGSGDSARKQHRENDGGEFSRLSPNTERYLAFLQKLKDMQDGLLLPFTLIISDPLSNSFVGPIPGDAVALSLQAEKEGNSRCYEEYVDTGMTVEEYERTQEQNEILGLNDMKTEKYGAEVDYGTDQLEEDPDRIRRLDVRGPDHPHEVGMAPVEGDTTVMGAKSKNFAVPSMGQRGKRVEPATTSQPVTPVSGLTEVLKMIHDAEYQDKDFIMNEEYVGPKEGMAFKDGGQGIGYYKDIPLHTLWELNQTSD
jgi:C4-type Zn-finger protein